MSHQTTRAETTSLENSTFNILIALGKEAQFLYSTIDTYISDAQKDNNKELEEIWKNIKEERKQHLKLLRSALEKEAENKKLTEQ